ncbi:MAG: tetratricopeptide repeat protein [Planctomycetota bacterium]|nr:tetratricopeptide repeat protein [Planctomycetota bacterium]
MRDAQGRVLVDVSYPYRPRMEAGTLERLRKQRLQVARLEKPGSPRERVEQADKWLIDGEVRRGRKRLEEALKEDPDHPRARLLRGELFLSQGLWGRAEVDLKAAEASAERGVSSEARFLRGVLARYRGNLMEAGDAFLKASVLEIHESQTWARAEQALAEVELAQGAALRAKGRLGRLCENPAHVTAQRMTLLALSRRLLGDCYGALSTVESVLRDDPLYLPARWERWAAAHYGRLEPFKVQLEEIHKLHESGAHPSADRAMEVAWWYANLGQYALAVTVLGASQFEDPRPSYLAAYLDARGGLAPTSWAEKHLDRAAKLRAEYAFPFRLEEEALFDWVTRQRPNDAQAWCLRGTLQGSFFRFDEAAGNFRKAVKLDPRDALAWRNLGICLWQLGRPPHVSTECFEQAHALRPDDPDIACELLSQYERMGRTEKRVALLEGASRGLRANHRFRKRALGILAEAGRFHEAVQLVEKQPFVRWEGEVSPHGVYAFGCLELCREALAGRRHAEAVRWAERAGRYPATTFTVRPSKPVDCIWRYWKAVALEASGKRKQAEAEYRKAADEGDWSVWYWISTEAPLWRAMARRRLGREREARADLKKVLKLSTRKELFYGGSTAFADYISALANLALGDREAAIKGLETVLKEGGLRFRARPWIAELRKAKGAKRFLWPHERMGQDTQQ